VSTRNGHTRTPLHRARLLRELTLEELASRSQVTMGAISRIETGETIEPHKLTKRALADALDFRISDIWPKPGSNPHPDLVKKLSRAR
jgi:transcriptional regulator with XRE-family HTH domain